MIELPCHFGFAATKASKSLAAGTFCTTNGFQPEISKPNSAKVTGFTVCEGLFICFCLFLCLFLLYYQILVCFSALSVAHNCMYYY